jgi:hypothetical protein
MPPPPSYKLAPGISPLHASTALQWVKFAQLAYEEEAELRGKLLKVGHQLISHERNAGVMKPAHFLSMSLEENIVVIGIKGTSGANDWLTNLFIEKEELRVKGGGGEEDFGIHAGMLKGARFVKEVGFLFFMAGKDIFNR